MYELLDQHRIMIPGCLDPYPKLTAFMANFEALPKIKAYMASDKFMKRPLNNKSAAFK
jgi:glutathione S-transferase